MIVIITNVNQKSIIKNPKTIRSPCNVTRFWRLLATRFFEKVAQLLDDVGWYFEKQNILASFGNIKLLRYSNVWSHCLLSWLSCYRRVLVNLLPPGGCSIDFSFHFKLELCWFDILYLQRRVTNFEQILVCRPRGRAAKYQKSFVDFNL